MYGSLYQDSLSTVIRSLYAFGKTGVLHLLREGVSKRIYFDEGSIVWASSDIGEEQLGEFLTRAGRIKPSDLALASEVMRQTGQDLSKTLVEMDFMLTGEMQALSAELVKAIIYSLFAWNSGEYRFEEGEIQVGEENAVRLSTAEVILEGVRRIRDSAAIRTALGDLTALLRWPQTPPLAYEESWLNPAESLVLNLVRSRLDVVLTAADIVAISPLGEEETLRCLYALASVGVLEIASPGPMAVSPAPVSSRAEMTRVSAGSPAREKTGVSGDRSRASRSSFTPASVPEKVGRYLVQDLIGRGSMGAVLLAKDPAIDRTVAIKLIQTSAQLDETQLKQYEERFYREAKAAGRLLHPGIVTVFDVGRTEETPFIVMEYVHGRTLKEVLETEGLELEEALRLSREILDALAYAHSQGVIHRDIKPANILVTSDRRVKIMDFGVAHVVGSEFTQAGDILGTPYYMAPEQLSKGKVDARTDLFAFGVVLYLILTGKKPFGGDSFARIAHGILFEESVPPDRINRAVSPALSRIVMRCLARDPARRFASAEEVKQALSSLPGVGTALAAAEVQLLAGPSLPLKLVRSGLFRGSLFIAVLLGLGLSLLLFVGREEPPEEPTPSAATGAVLKSEEPKPPVEGKPLEGREAEQGEKPAQREEKPAEGSGLFQRVADQLWKQTLPLSFDAQHNHRLGYCTGNLALHDWGVEYQSEKHGMWRWTFDQIRSMDRDGRWGLTIETYEKGVFALDYPRRYKFALVDAPLEAEDWARYRRLAR